MRLVSTLPEIRPRYASGTFCISPKNICERFPKYDDGVRQIRCQVLLVSIDTDQEFPPRCMHDLVHILNTGQPCQATAQEIKSAWGHLACMRVSAQLEHYIRDWMCTCDL